jgi:D-3-phosphoglycerate dehydrogenase
MASHRILNYGALKDEHVAFLEKQGHEVVTVGVTDCQAIEREIGSCSVAVASVALEYDEEVFARCPDLKVVARMGVGVDCIDLDAATRHGVQVVNTPEAIIEPVAEHTLSLLLAVVRNIALEDRTMREGTFRRADVSPGPELLGKTLGIVGFGNCGRRMAEIGHLGFSMNVLYHDIVTAPAEVEARLGAEQREFGALLEESDFVTVHVNLSDSTRGLFDEAAFRSMKETAYFVNCSRGPVVVEDALVRALEDGWIAGAGTDVFVVEPPPPDHPFFGLDNLVVSPHRGGRTQESAVEISRSVSDDVDRILRGEAPVNPVNRL